MLSLISIISAVILDQWLGEPKRHHPLVIFGNWAAAIEKQLNHQPDNKSVGSIALALAVLPILVLFWFIDSLLGQPFWLDILILYLCIAPNSLASHAMAVSTGLSENLNKGREAVGMIVSRDTSSMTEPQIVKATIESVLENGNDGIFGAIFWFILLGPVGAVAYRLVNTLDAMWGYKNERFIHFGWAAAKLDDLLNWAPAYVTAWTYAAAGQFKQGKQCLLEQSAQLESPNGGKVMAAGAGALGIKLGGDAIYHGKTKQKPEFGGDKEPINSDIHRAVDLVHRSLLFWIILYGVFVFVA